MLNREISRWWTVAAGAVGAGLGGGVIITYAFNIIAKNMIAEFGWTRDVVANLTIMCSLGSGLGLVTLGWLIARFGIRTPTVIFVLVCGFSLAAVSLSPPSLPFLLGTLFVFGVGGAAATAMPYAVAISGLFDRRRGMALGIVVAGSGVGAFIFPQMAELLVNRLGWRGAFAVTGTGMALIAAAGLVFFVRTPAGVVAPRANAGKRPSIIAACLRSRPFWFLALPIIAISVAVFGMTGSYVFLFADRGITGSTIAQILSFAGLASLVGRLVVGYVLDRLFAPYVTAAIFGLVAIGILMLITIPSTPVAFISAALIALALGAEADVLSFLASRYFSLEEYSRVVSILWVGWALGGGLGTVVMSQIYRLTGSYTAAFLFFAAIAVLGALLVCFIGPYRYPGTQQHQKPVPAAADAAAT